jgi:hypothetical protein
MDYVDKPSTDEWDIFTPPRWYIITPTLTHAIKQDRPDILKRR